MKRRRIRAKSKGEGSKCDRKVEEVEWRKGDWREDGEVRKRKGKGHGSGAGMRDDVAGRR